MGENKMNDQTGMEGIGRMLGQVAIKPKTTKECTLDRRLNFIGRANFEGER